MKGKATPEYEKCVDISTKASIREMILPGSIPLVVPIIVGFGDQWFGFGGAEVLGGLLAGVTVSGVLMGIFQNNAGGAWDNAKKSIEANGEKGSESHKLLLLVILLVTHSKILLVVYEYFNKINEYCCFGNCTTY